MAMVVTVSLQYMWASAPAPRNRSTTRSISVGVAPSFMMIIMGMYPPELQIPTCSLSSREGLNDDYGCA